MDWMTLFPAYTRRMPRFSALAQAVLSQAGDLEAVIRSIPAAYSPDHACGVQLDAVGEAIGLPRPDRLPDEDYRTYLLAKLALWRWDGTNGGLPDVLAAVLIQLGFSTVMAVIWLILESPDLAVTEAAVGAGITGVLFFSAFRRIGIIGPGRRNHEKKER